MTKYNNGSRYYKGAIKQGTKAVKAGIKALNYSRGHSSAIESLSGGIMVTGKVAFEW